MTKSPVVVLYGAVESLDSLENGCCDGDIDGIVTTTSSIPSSVMESTRSLRSIVSVHQINASASIPSEVANMTKNVIGGGVLSLPGGVALFYMSTMSAATTSVWSYDDNFSTMPLLQVVFSVVAWVVLLAAVFGYFCILIGKSCEMTRSSTWRECWERSVGPRGGLFVAVVNTLDPLVGIFANAAVMSQSLQLLLQGLLNVYWTVVECLLLVTVVGIFPLCLVKNLKALAPFSAAGMGAILMTLGVMLIRCLDGSYQPGGTYYNDVPPELQPSFHDDPIDDVTDLPAPTIRRFNTYPWWWLTGALPLVTMLYTSYDMHFNAPRYYAELRDKSIPRFTTTVSCSFGITTVVNISIALCGFLTFGTHSHSYILNNYSSKDPLAILSRLAIGTCALVTYPLNFVGIRDNCLDIFGIASEVNTAAKLNAFTILLLSILTVVSCFVNNLGLIMSVGGGTTVTLVDFVFPALMFHQGVQKYGRGTAQERWEAWFVMILMAIGVILGLIGVRESLSDAQTPAL